MSIIMRIIYFAFFISLILASCQKSNQNTEILPDNEPIVTYTLVDLGDGWGFKIYSGGSLLIEQLIIPCAHGYQKFNSRRDAEEIALLMIKKMQKGIFPPSIEFTELDSLKIEYRP